MNNTMQDYGANELATTIKKTRTQTSNVKLERGIQTKQLKEGGVLSIVGNATIRKDKIEGQNDCAKNSGSKFKPANHEEGPELTNQLSGISEQQEYSGPCGNSDDLKKASLQKSRSFGMSSCQLRTRGQNSSRDSQAINISSKRPEKSNSYPKDSEMSVQNGTNTRSSMTNSTGEDPNLKSGQKCGRNGLHSKPKEEKLDQENSENLDSEDREMSKDKSHINRKVKLAISWMKNLDKLEAQMNIPVAQVVPGEPTPKFCSNKSCPISEFKIPDNKKILKLAQKVNLRKTNFRDNEERRVYCLKCLNAHNNSLFCYYCGQIYFEEDNELNNDGKAWICCDDCSKWIHLDCDILVGKNNELKKHFNDEEFKYSCPECREVNNKKNKRSAKDSRKKLAYGERDKSASKQDLFDRNSNTNSINRNREVNSVMVEGENNYSRDCQMDDGNQRSSESFNSESEKRDSDMEADTLHHNGRNERNGRTSKRKAQLKRKSNQEKVKNNKRNHDDMSSQDSCDYISVQELTYLRSIRLSKEKEDLIEQRTLFSKVYATIKAQDRCLIDVDFLINKILNKCASDSDEQSSSPLKDTDHQHRGNADMSSFKMTNNSNKSLNETEYLKRLRVRRSRRQNESQY